MVGILSALPCRVKFGDERSVLAMNADALSGLPSQAIIAFVHEWALAEAVIESTSRALADRDPACLRSVAVRLGELQAIDREIFQFALDTLLVEKPFHQAVFKLEIEPAGFHCAACNEEWSLQETTGLTDETREAIHFLPEAAHAFVRCPACGSPDYSVVKGRGVSIESISLDATGACG
jgi:hydrogenase nickel incorporation protein HypA/HybF